MQITDNKEQVLLGVQRLRSLASCNPPTSLPCSLGLALELSMVSSRISTVKGSAPPVQLELLPLRPSFQKAQPPPASSCFNLWGSMNGYGPQSLRGIDVNQMPSSSESEGDPEEPPTLHLSGLAGLKREHEKASETDHERTFNEVTSRASDEEEGGSARKKLRLSKEQSALLEESFKEHSTLNPKQKNALAKQLNLRPRQVEVWFQNRRARTKLKQTEVDYELLKRCCESLSEENRRLHKEVAELRALKVGAPCVISHDFYMPLPATTLTMCPSCERLAPNAMGAAASSSTTMAANSVPFPKPHHFPLSFPPQQQPSAAC